MAGDPLMLFPERQHSHLRLAAAVSPGTRERRASGFGQPPRYTDRGSHGRAVRRDVLRVRDEHQRRQPTLGVTPELVLVLETNRQLSPEDVERAGLTVLELRSDTALVAFASDPELTEFLARNQQYQLGSPGLTDKGNERAAKYQELFDSIESLRGLQTADVLSLRASSLIDQVNTDDLIRVDIQCWCPENEDEARRRNNDVRAAVETAGGVVLDGGVRVEAAWSALCVEIAAGRIAEVASVDRVRSIDVLPQPVLSYMQLRATTPDDLPIVVAPAADAPIVAVIDSGLRSAHPLLSPAVMGVEYLGPGFGDGGDEAGHGTMVASLALYGSLEEPLAERSPLRAAGRLLSIRVLDAEQRFPDDRLWAGQMIDAMQLAVAAGTRVINLSLGDPRTPYSPPRPTAVATLVDIFIREHPDVVVVVSAGNFPPTEFTREALLRGTYAETLLTDPEAGLLDPATAALALTVGGLCGDRGQGAQRSVSTDIQPVGAPGLPSPWTRVGPGAMASVKPELCAPGGSAMVDTLQGRVRLEDPSASVVGAGGVEQNRLLAIGTGTSLAAPLVSHAARRVLTRYPELSGNAVRALLLLSARGVELVVEGLTESRNREQQRRLTGYGRISAERAEASTDHRAVLLSEASILVDDVHLYRVPIPSTFFASGGDISVSIALAYGPPVRATRLDYLANCLGVQVFHGASLAEVQGAYVKAEETTELDDDADATPSEISRHQLNLQPANTSRGRGAHQFGTYGRNQKFDSERGVEFIVAVRSVNRWDTVGAFQNYALAVALERDVDHADLYAELQIQLEAVARIDVETQVEIEPI
jgi:hypothetical protein